MSKKDAKEDILVDESEPKLTILETGETVSKDVEIQEVDEYTVHMDELEEIDAEYDLLQQVKNALYPLGQRLA